MPNNISQRLPIKLQQEGSEKSEQAEAGDVHPKTRKRKGTSHAWPEFTDKTSVAETKNEEDKSIEKSRAWSWDWQRAMQGCLYSEVTG